MSADVVQNWFDIALRHAWATAANIASTKAQNYHIPECPALNLALLCGLSSTARTSGLRICNDLHLLC